MVDIFNGVFENGEITGYGVRVWPNGSEYKGEWKNGEKHGNGTFENHSTGESYVGDWYMNVRQGGGKWTKANKEIIEGEFKNNQPQGQVSIRKANGDLYMGNVERGVIHGKGEYRYLETKMCYEGDFIDAKREGQGKFYAMNEGYVYTGEFKDDKPSIMPNQMIFYQEILEEDPEDKKKKDKKGDLEENENPNKLTYEIGVTEPLKIELRHVFQGEDYEDDTPLDEEELKKQAAKKGKGNDEPEVRMVTPDPIIVTQESGRKIEIELGRFEEVPVEEGEEQEEEPEKVWKQYKFKQENEENKFEILSKEGVILIDELKFDLNEEFKQGKYEIICKDITPFIDNHLNEVKIALEIIDPEDPLVPVKGKKK